MKHNRTCSSGGVALALLVALAGCGGGGGDSVTSATNTNTSTGSGTPAATSGQADGQPSSSGGSFMNRVMAMIGATSETAEPEAVGNTGVSTSDDAEPAQTSS